MSYQPPPPPPPWGHPQRGPAEQEKAGLFRAGKVAIWVWVALSLIPIVLILACCGFCGLGSVIGAADPSPTPSY